MICEHASTCGGCSLLHLSYDAQLASKEASLRALLGPLLPERLRHSRRRLFLPVFPHTSTPEHFRQKVAFVFGQGPRGGGLIMGHYQRGSKRIVPVTDCPIHSRRGNRIAFALRDELARAGINAVGSSRAGILRHILIRTTLDDCEAVAMLVVTRNDKTLRQPMRALLQSSARPDGFFVNINTNPGPLMVGDRTIRIDGRGHIREEVGGFMYQVSPTAFFQTNVSAAAALQEHVVATLEGRERVLDLYCGSGLFSLRLAAGGVRVTGIEENRQAIADAESNARLNGIPATRARFVAARVEQGLRRVCREQWDAVILDPPRQGCSDEVLEAVFQELRPAQVTYVSCNPESLAAELPGILQCGYEIEDLVAVDMFPHTDHIEAVATLTRSMM